MAERREKVILELQDGGFSTQMVKNAAATGLLEKALKSLDGTTVHIHERISESATQMDRLSKSSQDADSSINQLTGRLRLFADAAAIFGPAAGPIGGVLAAGVGGFASQLGFAAVGAGVLAGSMQGLGDALGAMNTAQLEPTEKNLQKAADALDRLSPAASGFAKEAFALKPALVAIRDIGAEALFPGLTESLDSLEDLGPRVGAIFEAIGSASGEIAADAAASLASDRWADFFQFIEDEAPKALSEMSATIGDVAHGLAELWQAFTPLNNDFSSWLMGVADGFDAWATGLDSTEGFQEFIEYVREVGPQVAETAGALANAIVQIVQATAPLGGPVLAAVEGFANAIGAIADSDLGTPIFAGIAALALLNRALATTAALSKTSLSGGMFASLGTVAGGAQKGAGGVKALSGNLATLSRNYLTAGTSSERMAAQNKKALDGIKGTARAVGPTVGLMGGLAVASSGAADALGLTNTTSLALMGTLGGPPGIALGAAAGALLDIKAAGEGATTAIDGLGATAQSGNIEALRAQIEAAKTELTDINDLDFGGDILDRIGFQVADTFGGTSADEAQQKIDDAKKAVEELTKAEEARVAGSRRAALTYASEVGLNASLSKWRTKSVEEIKAQADALKAVDEEADAVSSSFLKMPESVNDAKVSLGDFITEMQKTADALANFNDNSIKAAKKGLDEGLIESLRKMGPEGALRMKQFANGTKEQIDRANKAFQSTQREMERTRDIARDLAGISPINLQINADNGPAMARLYEVQRFQIADKTFRIHAVRVGGGADGGVDFLSGGSRNALGDFKDRHHPEIAGGNSLRVWAEPETGGESYIPHANDYRRPRAKNILEKTASIMGGEVQWFADGGMVGPGGRVAASSKGFKPEKMVDFATDAHIKELKDALRALTKTSEAQTSALEASTQAVEDSKSVMDGWAAKMSDLAQSTVSGFNTGLFDKSSNPWAAGAGGGAVFNLQKDIAGLEQRGALQEQLAGMGLSGDTLAALLREADGPQGNAQIQGLIASGQVSQYADLFAQRAAMQGTVGSAAGQQAYGQEYASAAQNYAAQQAANAAIVAEQKATTKATRNVEKQLERTTRVMERFEASMAERTGEAVGKAINGGAADAQRDRKNRGNR